MVIEYLKQLALILNSMLLASHGSIPVTIIIQPEKVVVDPTFRLVIT